MLLCLCFPSAALTLDNRLGLSEDELEELGLTESMEDGDALETYFEHEEDRYLEHEEDLAQLEEMEVQDRNATTRRRKKGGARRRRRSPGGKPGKLTIGKRVKALEKQHKVLTAQVLKLKATVKSHSTEIPLLKETIKKLVAAVDSLEQAIGNGNNDENDNENDNENNNNNDDNDENDNDNNNNDELAPAPAPTYEKTTTTTTKREPLATNSRSACNAKQKMEECKWSRYSRLYEGVCQASYKYLYCKPWTDKYKACYIVDGKKVDMKPWDACKYGSRGQYTGVCMVQGYYNNTMMYCRKPKPDELPCKEKAHGDECSVGSVKVGECYLVNTTNRMFCKHFSPYQRPCVDKEIGDKCVYKYWKYGGLCGKDTHNKKYLRCYELTTGRALCHGKKADEDCTYTFGATKKPGLCKEKSSSMAGATAAGLGATYLNCMQLTNVFPESTAACKNKTLGQLCEYNSTSSTIVRKRSGGCVSHRPTDESEPLWCKEMHSYWKACHGKKVNESCSVRSWGQDDYICREAKLSYTEGANGIKPYISCGRNLAADRRRRRSHRRRRSDEDDNDNEGDNNEDD